MQCKHVIISNISYISLGAYNYRRQRRWQWGEGGAGSKGGIGWEVGGREGGRHLGNKYKWEKNIYDNDDGDAVGDDDGDENENDDTGGLEDGEVWLA